MTVTNSKIPEIEIVTVTDYVPQQSDPKNKRFVFYYTITIRNHSPIACQLMSRHWVIIDANRKVEEIYGEGVIGEQPVIAPGGEYQYSSGAVLETEIGTMEGRYFMIVSDASTTDEFEIPIPKFTLTVPRVLH
ncbi:Co2+/Mg2+ efflux protein ApaG [Arenicella xantha]|uniref:Protein ApaG n=1 Tax=Arenicella xantha TaxID=644221 RepID=A0A395JTE1_9GAMM|nr:Co2+/Mg2+ efflux protein ApaG [Arenicella xantha]RBP53756.1 ApaG protein [Arenicella xantha]